MTQIDTHSTVIEGDTYEVYMLDPDTAMDLLVELAKVAGPAITGLVGMATDKGLSSVLEADTSDPGVADAVAGFFGKLDAALLRRLTSTLAKMTHVNGKPLSGIYAMHFRGRLGLLFQWLGFALKAQYSDFSKGLRALGASGGDMATTGSPSPNI